MYDIDCESESAKAFKEEHKGQGTRQPEGITRRRRRDSRRPMKRTFAFLALLLSMIPAVSTLAATQWNIAGFTVIEHWVEGDVAFVRLDSIPFATNFCSAKNTFYFDLTTSGQKQMAAIALSAALSSKKVSVAWDDSAGCLSMYGETRAKIVGLSLKQAVP